MSRSSWETYKPHLLELFVVSNFAFLALDIYLAHSVNEFRHRAEWIPFYFSIFACVVMLVALILYWKGLAPAFWRYAGLFAGSASILVGVGGLLYHLGSRFFSEMTIISLVYTAPFTAPLAYAGLGFLLLLNRMVPSKEIEWGLWIVFLALGGFIGNFALSLADHAQNGFFFSSEWIPVFGSALAVGFLTMSLFERSITFLKLCLLVMALQAAIGLLGFYFHLAADFNGISSSLYENFIHGAPIFAPLLFVNLVILAVLGIWDIIMVTARGQPLNQQRRIAD